MPETKQTGRPLSYYMRNGLWHFTQPPDTLSGQVIPKSTVEQWLEKTLEIEAEITRLREQVEEARKVVKQAHDAIDALNDGGMGPLTSIEGVRALIACSDFLSKITQR
jgi:hypothetical protein